MTWDRRRYDRPGGDGPGARSVEHLRETRLATTKRAPFLKFTRGRAYSRGDVMACAGATVRNPRNVAHRGIWDTGVVSPASAHDWVIFCNVGGPGRTGDYPNRWNGRNLHWFHKKGSHLEWPSVQKMLYGTAPIHVFWRFSYQDSTLFEYAGLATVLDVKNSSPVECVLQVRG